MYVTYGWTPARHLNNQNWESFTFCCVDENFRDAAHFIAQISIDLFLQMAFYTAPGVKTGGENKRSGFHRR